MTPYQDMIEREQTMKRITSKYLASFSACWEAQTVFAERFPKGASVKVVFDALIPDKLDWANWLIARLLNHKNRIRYAIYVAEQVIEIFEKKYPDDTRPRKAIEATKAVLKKNNKDNRDAAHAASYAAHAAAHVSYAAYAAAHVSYAAYAAAYAAANAAAHAAADAAAAAVDAAANASCASYAAVNAATKERIIRYGLRLFNAQRLKEGK